MEPKMGERDFSDITNEEGFVGITLEQWLTHHQPSLQCKLHCALRLLEVLAQLHQRGWLLNAVCPSSILIDPDTLAVRLADLAGASPLGTPGSAVELADDLQRLHFQSPESTGRTNLITDHRSDFYSLGVLLYWLFTGVEPFQSNDANNLVYQHLATIPVVPVARNADIPPVVSAIIMKLLAKSPAQRYQNHAGLRAALQRCLDLLERGAELDVFVIGTQER